MRKAGGAAAKQENKASVERGLDPWGPLNKHTPWETGP